MKKILPHLPRAIAALTAAGTALVAANGQPTNQALGAAVVAAALTWINWKPRSSAS